MLLGAGRLSFGTGAAARLMAGTLKLHHVSPLGSNSSLGVWAGGSAAGNGWKWSCLRRELHWDNGCCGGRCPGIPYYSGFYSSLRYPDGAVAICCIQYDCSRREGSTSLYRVLCPPEQETVPALDSPNKRGGGKRT